MEISKGRIGQYLFILGLFFLVIFFATDQSQNLQPGFFFAGLPLTLVGASMMWKSWKPQKSTRFRLFNDARQKMSAKKSQEGKK